MVVLFIFVFLFAGYRGYDQYEQNNMAEKRLHDDYLISATKLFSSRSET
jgi:hypothetical protein